MRIHLLLFALLAIEPLSAAKTLNACVGAKLPAQVESLVNSKFPGWRAKMLSDLDQDDRQLWSKAHPDACPGLAVGKFQRPDQIAYAILLVPTSEPTGGYKVIVVAKADGSDDYSVQTLDHANGAADSGLVISKAPPGKYSDFDDMSSIKSKLDAVNVEWIEKGAVLYYYSRGKYHKLQTSD